MILATEGVITAILKIILATKNVILANDELNMSTTEKSYPSHHRVISVTEEVTIATLKMI